MGLLDKMQAINETARQNSAKMVTAAMPKKDGMVHAVVVGVKSTFDWKSATASVDVGVTTYLNDVLIQMQDDGLEILDVKPAISDMKDYSFLITYR